MKIYVGILSVFFASTLAFANTKDSKIVGGSEAAVGEFPFIVSLQDGQGHFCGGSLIRPNWVLTAAHCVGQGVNKVVVGLHSLKDTQNVETLEVKRIIRHPKFQEVNMDYDYALIELNQNSRYEPVALNTAEISIPVKGGKILATTAGWGLLMETSFNLPENLQKVEVPLIAKSVCSRDYYKNRVTNRMICAGYESGGKDSCQGDSGGPLVATAEDNSVYLIGVVSWGEGCARARKPGVYSKVNVAIPWITKYIQN